MGGPASPRASPRGSKERRKRTDSHGTESQAVASHHHKKEDAGTKSRGPRLKSIDAENPEEPSHEGGNEDSESGSGCLSCLSRLSIEDIMTPFLSMSDIVTDVYMAQHFWKSAAREQERPVFFCLCMSILCLSAAAGSAFTLIQNRQFVRDKIKDCANSLSSRARGSSFIPCLEPLFFFVVFVLLIPVGHILPVALWAMATWRHPPVAPKQALIHARRERLANEADDWLLRRRLDKVQEIEAKEVKIGSYEEYSAAYRDHLREALAMGSAPEHPELPVQEGFASKDLIQPEPSQELKDLNEKTKRAQQELQDKRQSAEAEWRGEKEGPVQHRQKHYKKDAHHVRGTLLKSMQKSEDGVIGKSNSEVHPPKVGWDILVDRLEGTLKQGFADQVPEKELQRAALTEVEQHGLAVRGLLTPRSSKLLSSNCASDLLKLGMAYNVFFIGMNEMKELNDMKAKITAQGKVVSAARVQFNKAPPEKRNEAQNALHAAENLKKEFLSEAEQRAQLDQEIKTAKETYQGYDAQRKETQANFDAEMQVFNKQVERQQLMVANHERAEQFSCKIMQGEHNRAKVEHRVMAEAGFIVETGLESVPQSILQCVALAIMTQEDPDSVDLLTDISVFTSVVTVLSKVYIFCTSMDVRVFGLKLACLCCDLLILFYTCTTLFTCQVEKGHACISTGVLTRKVDFPSAIWVWAHISWWFMLIFLFVVTPLGLWGKYLVQLGGDNADNPLQPAAKWIFGTYELSTIDIIGMAIISLPIAFICSVLIGLFVPPLIALLVATLRLSYFVIMLHVIEARLFQGPLKTVYQTAYQFIMTGRGDERHLLAAVKIIKNLGIGSDPPSGSTAAKGYRMLCLVVKVVKEEVEQFIIGSLGIQEACAGVFVQKFLWLLLLPTTIYTVFYVPWSIFEAIQKYLGTQQIDTFRVFLVSGAILCWVIASQSILCSSAGIFLQFALSVPPPLSNIDPETLPPDAEILMQLESEVVSLGGRRMSCLQRESTLLAIGKMKTSEGLDGDGATAKMESNAVLISEEIGGEGLFMLPEAPVDGSGVNGGYMKGVSALQVLSSRRSNSQRTARELEQFSAAQ